jgi:competence protein ComEA
LLIVILGLLTVDAWRRGNGAIRPLVVLADLPPEEFFAVEVNSASWVEWAQLEGLGETLARRIVEDRDEHGPFQAPDDLLRVRGIGQRTLNRIRPFLVGFPSETPTALDSQMEADSP